MKTPKKQPNTTCGQNKPADRKLEAYLAAIPEGTEIDHYERHAHTLELFVTWPEPGRGDRHCPKCGSTRCIKKDGGAMQTVRHVRSGEFGLLLTFHKPRFFCKDCGQSFYVKPDWVISNMSITTYVLIEITSRLTSTTQCVEQIARDTNTSASIVLNVMYHIKLDKPKNLPVTLGIDEFHGKTGTYNSKTKRFDTEKYHCVITDPDHGCVLDILYKATYRHLYDYFMEYPSYLRRNVKYFCADMRSGFSKVARNFFPNAKICIDPFHVIKLLNEAVDDVRLCAWHGLTEKVRKLNAKVEEAKESGDEELVSLKTLERNKAKDDAALIKSSRIILITAPYKDTAYWNRHEEKREQRLKEIYAVVPELETARDALYDFHIIAEHSEPNHIKEDLTDWLNKYSDCDLPPIRQAASSIRKRRGDIENAWKYGKSNGVTEGLNKKIKDIRRMGFGAHSFENFSRRALLACGPTTIETVQYTIFGEKDTAPGRETFPLYG